MDERLDQASGEGEWPVRETVGQAPTEARLLVQDLYRALGTAEGALLGAADTLSERQESLAASLRQWAAEITAAL